ncbi:MAG: bifunctional phosphoribosylaminoimidazolecarboxamide formyltransferase/IMP cyclohydrolase [marine benthic group bacterium]|nr:bifunctional phosphoribosylaminoimidazolecarboxamide formyltransferase/IMP cyclohydrolase [Gemmatimonadota bacterium]
MPYAILSVSDKTGIGDLAAALHARGWTLLSTGGTAQAIREASVPVTGIGEHTGFPEILGGRVKTLHPAVHAGLLARPTVESDVRDLERHDLKPVGIVVVNLYPFRETIARPDTTLAGALEQIDIGGPTMLRAAAKNHPFVWPVCDPTDYERLIAAIDEGGDQDEFRRALATKVFAHTAAYDSAVAGYLRGSKEEGDAGGLPEDLMVSLSRVQSLRYGENPDQPAAFYRVSSGPPLGIPGLRQLHGKDLSYNNILDLDGALLAIAPFLGGDQSACAILKHTTPCGIAVGRSPAEAYRKALACDPVSAFGSTVVFSEPVTEAVAEELAALFVECLVAPGYAPPALTILRQKQNIRILKPDEDTRFGSHSGHLAPGLDLRGVIGGVLVQGSPAPARPSDLRASGATVATTRAPSDAEWEDLAFAWAAVQSVKSNAILLARDGAAVGIGAGQMSRVDAAHLAAHKATAAGFDLEGLVLASDAFFPFRDGVDAAAEAGVTAIIQPGGSKRDAEAIAAADEHGISMVFTGRRTFRH